MVRPVTLFTGQWADVPIATMVQKAASFGYDGLEVACSGDHFAVDRALGEEDYIQKYRDMLAEHNLKVWAVSNHLVGQMVLDPNDQRSDDWAPAELAGDPEGKRAWAIEEMKRTGRAAQRLGVDTITGFTGSSIWQYIYPWPPVSAETIAQGFEFFAEKWGPIFDVYSECGVRFALEVHPTEIAFDLYSSETALKAVGNHPAFGFNFDPSHLVWQGVDPVEFIYAFPERIYQVHMKDVKLNFNGRAGMNASHLPFGDPRRGWDFRSVGRGDVDFEAIIRALDNIGYTGPLSVEWEDNGMDREFGATESCQYVRDLQFPASAAASFEDAFKVAKKK